MNSAVEITYMYIPRLIQAKITSKLLNDNKVIVIYGPRQVGKTTMVNNILDQVDLKTLRIDAEDTRYKEVLSSKNLSLLEELVSGYQCLFIDEAQTITEIGSTLKLLHDHFPDLKIITTGSSSFDLANKLGEPLTGRKWTYTLLPISYQELLGLSNKFELKQQLSSRLIWGSYPNIFSYKNKIDKKDFLQELSTDYLYKDILQLSGIRGANKIHKLLKLLSFQVGSQVSLSELGQQLSMSKDTVAHYISLLEKSFVLFRLTGFSRNLRKEVSKSDKFYFYDLGIRNVLIDALKPLESRNDVGQLWENFLAVERLKKNNYKNKLVSHYFWRVYSGGEIDFIEETGDSLSGFEFKYSDKKVKPPPSWISAYPDANFEVVSRENFLDFVL